VLNNNEHQARLLVQRGFIPVDQVNSLYVNFQSAPSGSSDFCDFLERHQLLSPALATQVRSLANSESSSPLQAHTKVVDTAALYRSQELQSSAVDARSVSSESSVDDFSLQRSIETTGALIGQYQVIAELGRGGMGVVYHARDTKLGRDVALKMLRSSDVDELVAVERFEIEARAMARLHHPNIIEVYNIDTMNGMVIMAMPLITGGTLADLLKRAPLLEYDHAMQLCECIARALDHAHERNIIHRDLKPANILLNDEEMPVLTDFGLAKAMDSTSRGLSKTGQFMGTLAYTSPEQVQGSRLIDGRTDIYSLGVTLFSMLTARLPFQGSVELEIIKKILSSEAPAIKQFRSDVPGDIEIIVSRCLAKDPNQRYGTALELAEDCSRWLAGEAIEARRPTLLEDLQRSYNQQPVLFCMLGFTTALIALLLGFSIHLNSVYNELDVLQRQRKSSDRQRDQFRDQLKSLTDKLKRSRSSEKWLKIKISKQLRALESLRKSGLRGLNLRAVDLSRARLVGIDFSEAILDRSQFVNSDLSAANFQDASLKSCNLTGANLTGAKLSGADLQGANLQGANLSSCQLESVVWSNAIYNSKTAWPDNFDPVGARLLKRERTKQSNGVNTLQAENSKEKGSNKTRNSQVKTAQIVDGQLRKVSALITGKQFDTASLGMASIIKRYRQHLVKMTEPQLFRFASCFAGLVKALHQTNRSKQVDALIAALPKNLLPSCGQWTALRYQQYKEALQSSVKAREALDRNEFEVARALLRQTIKTDAEYKAIQYAFEGWIADKKGELDKAAKLFRKFQSTYKRLMQPIPDDSWLVRFLADSNLYSELLQRLKSIDLKYIKNLRALGKLARNKAIKAVLSAAMNRIKIGAYSPCGLYRFPLHRPKVAAEFDKLRNKKLSQQALVKELETLYKKSPTFYPLNLQMAQLTQGADERIIYQINALQAIWYSPEIASDEEFTALVRNLREYELLSQFFGGEVSYVRQIKKLCGQARILKSRCLTHILTERLVDCHTLPSEKLKYRQAPMPVKSVPEMATLRVKCRGRATIKVGSQAPLSVDKSEKVFAIKFSIGDKIQIEAQGDLSNEQGLMLVIRLSKSRFFFLSPRHGCQSKSAGPDSERLVAIDYEQFNKTQLAFPICWAFSKDTKALKSIKVTHKIQALDFRRYVPFKPSYGDR
jgi:serine/threonine protein kinase